MNGLTFLACPKPSTGLVAVTQRNAIESWTRLVPRPRIVLFGDEPGTATLCAELKLDHVPDVRRNERGTPLFDDLLARSRQFGDECAPWCFINADIVLTGDFTEAVARVVKVKRQFLIIGQRTDLDLTWPIDFANPGWKEILQEAVRDRGRLHGVDGIDFFVFTPGLFDPVPPLLIGRASIDNWLVFRARQRWRPVIDATEAITAVHQNHDYAHHREGRFGVYHGEEAQTNYRLAGGHERHFWISDRTHRLTREGLTLDLTPAQLRRHWDRLPVLVPAAIRPAVLLLHLLQRRAGDLLRRAGLRKPLQSRQ